ncbi:hypothetical protein SAY87_007461 [Trapa incisa]|uniref:Uncharacterized protein n=1 Tax=Trapa incisa TaxID=236973 RepID=A0AAN7KEH5_9MYRT|nr:hypothetical protein SAY87_007461 [Trapa incisa]
MLLGVDACSLPSPNIAGIVPLTLGNMIQDILLKKPATVFNLRQYLATSTAAYSSFFQTEQSNNDYITSLCKQNLHKKPLTFRGGQRVFRCALALTPGLIYACSCLRSLDRARTVHNHIRLSRHAPQSHPNMFGKCEYLEDARKVFDEILYRNAISLTVPIAGYSHNGKDADVLELYLLMLELALKDCHGPMDKDPMIHPTCSRIRWWSAAL